MSTDAQVLERVRHAFASCVRPEHFTNYRHCCECAEHDEVLRSRDLDTLSIDDVGNQGWDPICFITPEGFAYYLPALARLAAGDPLPPYGWYAPQLLFHLCLDGARNVRVLACTTEQRHAVVDLLSHLVATRADLVDSYGCSEELLKAVEYWSDESGAAGA
jgi:hypothetical protein